MRAIVAVGLATVLGAAVLAACGGATDPRESAQSKGNVGVVESREKPQTGGKIVYGLFAETNGWNPGTNQWASSGMLVARTLYDTITQYDENLDIHPYLAERFEHNPEYTQWVFTFRPGVKLHNGKTLTASMVKRNQDYLMKSPVTGGAYIVVKDFEVKGELTLAVNLTEPWVTFPQAWATQIGVVGDPDWMESNDGVKPIGTGPFKLDEWTIGSKVVVKKNLDYWQKDADGTTYPYLDEIEFNVITDDASRSAALKSGGLDILQTNDPDQIVEFRKKGETGEYQVFSNSKGETSEVFVMLNTAVPPLDDVDARRALAYATDKEGTIDVIANGLFQPANGAFAPNSRWYNPEVETAYPQYDPVKARELVEKVKAKNGGKFEFKLLGAPDPTSSRTMAFVQQMWAQSGIDVILESSEQAKMIINVVTGGYQAIVFQHFEAPHPVDDSIFWLPEEARPIPEFSLNFARLKDDQIDAALRDARQTTDPKQEVVDYGIVQKRQAELVPYVWVAHAQQVIVATNRLVNVINYTLPDGAKGVEYSYGSHPLYQVWVRR